MSKGIILNKERNVILTPFLTSNTGKVTFDADIKTYADSVDAIVYKQDALGAVRSLGSPVNIYLTLDQSKLPAQ